MKLHSQKGKKVPVHILNEQEIQERLYGRYHKSSVALKEAPRLAGQAELTPPHLETAETPLWKEARAWVGRAARAFAGFLKMLPWKLASALGIALAATIFLSQSVPVWVHEWNVNQNEVKVTPVQEHVPAAPIKKPPVSIQKFYTVQVCTYQRERDAQDLVHQLQGMGLPAFSQKTSARDQGIALHLVFLGRSATYAEAKNQLEEFRKSSLFHKFSDSFIRSVTNSGTGS